MRYIKTFEFFDFSKTLPISGKSDLAMYYNCNDCNALWESFNEKSDGCRFCNSSNIKELNEDEYFDLVESRLDDDEVVDLRDERKGVEMVNLFSLGKDKRRYVN